MSEVRRGYKQTEVGVIPEDWDDTQLQDTADKGFPICYGIVQVGPSVAQGVRVLAIKNLNGDYSSDIHVAAPAVERPYARSRVQPDDVLISVKGTTGRVGIVPPGFHGNISRDIARVRPASDVWPSFLYQMLQSNLAQSRMQNATVGTTRMELSIGTLKDVHVPLPPTRQEQESIAEALSDADALIESLEQLLTKKRQIKQGAIQDLLTGKKRLPGFAARWQDRRLGDLGECYRGVSYNPATDLSPFDTARTVRLLRSNNIEDASIVLTDLQFVDSIRVSEDQMLRADDVLICMANGSRDLVGKAARFAKADAFQYTFGAFMGCFRPDGNEVDPGYAFWLFQTERYREQVAVLLAGSSINNLSPGSINGLLVDVSSDKPEQTAIASVLSDMDSELSALETKLAKARHLKQAMMQELLTGRIRLV